MISAGSAVSDNRTAPRTDCSASRFWGGVSGPSGMRGAPPFWPLPWLRSKVVTGRPSLGRGGDGSGDVAESARSFGEIVAESRCFVTHAPRRGRRSLDDPRGAGEGGAPGAAGKTAG